MDLVREQYIDVNVGSTKPDLMWPWRSDTQEQVIEIIEPTQLSLHPSEVRDVYTRSIENIDSSKSCPNWPNSIHERRGVTDAGWTQSILETPQSNESQNHHMKVGGSTQSTTERPQGDADWDKYRATITQLYQRENKTLPQVLEIMQRQYNVRVT